MIKYSYYSCILRKTYAHVHQEVRASPRLGYLKVPISQMYNEQEQEQERKKVQDICYAGPSPSWIHGVSAVDICLFVEWQHHNDQS